MAGFTLVSTQTIIARNAGALYGLEVGNANMTSYVSQVGSNIDAFLNTVYTNSVGTASTSAVADVLISNLGITGDSTDPTSAAGIAKSYIVGQLNAVAYTARGAVVNSILNAFANLTSDPTFGSFATTWNTKVSNAVTYASVSGNNDSSFTTVSTTPAGQSFTLTTGADNRVGGDGDDTFDGSQNSNGADTFSALDSITGGSGTDTLTVQIKAGSAVAPAVLSGVEIVNIASTAANSGINFGGATGVTKINLSGSTNTAVATGITSTSIALGVANTASSATFTLTDNALSGSSDTVNLTISNVTGGTVTVQPTGGTTTNGAETFALTSTGSGSNTLANLDDGAGTSWTKLTIAGDQGIDLGTALPAPVATLTSTNTSTGAGVTAIFTAGAPTVTGGVGNDSFSFTTTAGNVSVDGGAGNDTFTFNGTGTLTSADTVKGGDGTNDKIVTTSAEAVLIGSTLTNVSGIEHLQISDATTGAINATYFGTGVNQVTFANGVNNTGTITLNSGTTTATFKGTASGAAINLTANGSGTTDAVKIVTDTANQLNGQAITGTGVETLTIEATKIAQTAGAVTLTGSGSANTTLNLTGGFSFTTSGALEAKTIDASGMTVGSTSTGLVMASAATTNTAQTITGSGGIDTIYGSSGADSITAGAGNDSITAGAGNDTVLGGDGNDTIVFGANYTTGDSIDGGSGTDTLSLSSASVTAVNALSLAAVLTLNDRVSNIEKLSFSDDFGASFDLARADNISDVTLAAASNSGYTLSSFGATNSLTLTQATNNVAATLADASGSSDVFNLVLQNAATTNFGTVTVGTTASSGQVETVNLSSTEGTTPNSTVRVHTVALNSAAGLKTLNLSGTESITSTVSAETLATVNASGLTEGVANITATASLVAMTVTGSNQNDTFSTGSGADSVSGGVGDDNLTGGAGNDTLDGGAGNDTIVNGVGVDSLVGGDGTDTLSQTGWTISTTTDGGTTAVLGTVVNLGSTSVSAATIAGYKGFDTTAALSSDLSAIGSNQAGLLGTAASIGSRVDTLSGFENVTGSSGKDYIVGSSAANTITGGAGADVMSGGSAADTFVEATTDSVVFSAKSRADGAALANGDTITFGNGVDVITDFVSGTDFLDTAGTSATPTTLIGLNSDAVLTNNTVYGVRGDLVKSTGVFTLSATGADYLVVDGLGGALSANAGVVILTGVTALVAADLI